MTVSRLNTQKTTGAYYTPSNLAEAIIKLMKPNIQDVKYILEPSCGNGIFIDALEKIKQKNKFSNIMGIDNNKYETDILTTKYQNDCNIKIVNEDFYAFYNRNKGKSYYDLIIGNPPYLHYRMITKEQQDIQDRLFKDMGMKQNKLTNAWAFFLTACISMLKDNGWIAFIIPSEIMSVGYAEEIRKMLVKTTSSILLLTFSDTVFKDIQQDIVVLIAQKNLSETRKRMCVTHLKSIEDIEGLNLDNVDYLPPLPDGTKWTQYFLTASERNAAANIASDVRFNSL